MEGLEAAANDACEMVLVHPPDKEKYRRESYLAKGSGRLRVLWARVVPGKDLPYAREVVESPSKRASRREPRPAGLDAMIDAAAHSALGPEGAAMVRWLLAQLRELCGCGRGRGRRD